MKFLLIPILFLAACATEPRFPPEGQQVRTPQQWIEYCEREGMEDPACK